MTKFSPILQVFYGERTNDNIKLSESYNQALAEVIDSEEEFMNKIKDKPEILKAYEDLQQKNEKFLFEEINATYIEGFSFGMLLGFDVVEKSAK